MQVADNCVGTFSAIHTFINEVVHLNRYTLSTNTKNTTLSRCEKIYRARLQWIGRIVDLKTKSRLNLNVMLPVEQNQNLDVKQHRDYSVRHVEKRRQR